MAITNNPMTAGWTGALGKQVVFRQLHGKTVSSAYPDLDDRKLSPKQISMNKLMKDANLHARAIMSDERLRDAAQLRFNVPRNKLYISLIREYLKTQNSSKEEKVKDPETAALADKDTLFVNYLLQHTDKTVEEIAILARVPVEFVEKAKM